MTVNEMIIKYDIALMDDGRIRMRGDITPQEIESIKAAKEDIKDELRTRKGAEEAARREAAEKLAVNVPGLDILRKVRSEWETYNNKFEKFIDNDAMGNMPVKPEVEYKEAAIQYPAASAYLKAEGYKYSGHYEKTAIGKKAMERIVNGENYEVVIAEMESEWSNAAMAHIWD
jgi:hypothetical protein